LFFLVTPRWRVKAVELGGEGLRLRDQRAISGDIAAPLSIARLLEFLSIRFFQRLGGVSLEESEHQVFSCHGSG
jgi:hypothetical protein